MIGTDQMEARDLYSDFLETMEPIEGGSSFALVPWRGDWSKADGLID
jgi:hypothetical protein